MYSIDYMIEIIEDHCSKVDNKLMDWDGKNPESLVESFLEEEKECMRFLANEDYSFIHNCDDYELIYYYLMWRINFAEKVPDDDNSVFICTLQEYTMFLLSNGYSLSDCILATELEEQFY